MSTKWTHVTVTAKWLASYGLKKSHIIFSAEPQFLALKSCQNVHISVFTEELAYRNKKGLWYP